MRDLGKEMLPKREIEEEEVRRLLLGIMEGYYDTVIPPLSFFSPSAAEKSRKRQRGDASCDESLLKERKRREHISENFAALRSMVPTLFNIKSSRETTINETIDYIKYLEEEAKRLEGLKQFQLENPVLFKCTNHNSSVKVGVSNEATFFAVQLPSRRGSVLKIVKVLEKHRAQILEARIFVNDQRQLTFTATITLRSGGGSTIDKIREEILSLQI